MTRIGLLCFCVCTIAGHASAQDRTDSLYLTGAIESIGTQNGRSGSLLWVQMRPGGAGYQAGIFSSSAADTTISYGQVGARTKMHDLTLSGSSDIGTWRDAAGQFGYFGYRLGLALEMKPGLIMDGDTQYVRYKPDNDFRVWRAGVAWHVVKPATVQSSYYISSIDRRHSPAVSVRTDLAVRRTTAIAGLVVGVHRSFFDDRGVAEPASREYFGGWQVPVKRTTITGLVDLTTTPARKGRTVVTLQIPLSSKRPIP